MGWVITVPVAIGTFAAGLLLGLVLGHAYDSLHVELEQQRPDTWYGSSTYEGNE